MTQTWQSGVSVKRLQQRAHFLAEIRAFFASKNVMEVDVPLLTRYPVSDVQLSNMRTQQGFYLHTSPEYYMKRLLAQASGDIYFLGHVFRPDELGSRHHQEFMLLEWYRMHYDHIDLMKDVAALCCYLVPDWAEWPVQHSSYVDLMQRYTGLDVWEMGEDELRTYALASCPGCETLSLSRLGWLDYLFTQLVEPHLGQGTLQFVCDYLPEQAALARLYEHRGKKVAARFELYIQGLELCNGYWELADSAEQEQRFAEDNATRQRLGLPQAEADPLLLEALRHCTLDAAGVALGVDRLLMLRTHASSIRDVLPFTADFLP